MHDSLLGALWKNSKIGFSSLRLLAFTFFFKEKLIEKKMPQQTQGDAMCVCEFECGRGIPQPPRACQ